MPNELPLITANAVEGSNNLRRVSSVEQVTSPLLHTPAQDAALQKSQAHERWRYMLGLSLLAFTVVLWTTSNFLASTLFADDTYSKPYLVTYVNTSFFVLPLIPMTIRQVLKDPGSFYTFFRTCRTSLVRYRALPQDDDDESDADFFKPTDEPSQSGRTTPTPNNMHLQNPSTQPTADRMTLTSTIRLGLEFCLLWFLANYFVAACLSYTTVASSTILTSTSSVFTLLFGILFRVETFSLTKSLGVLASLAGIALISTVDLSGSSDKHRGSFPHKSVHEIAVGDVMALISAVLYGIYAVFMKARIGDESRVNMPLFFGLVGLFNVLLLWPGFFILHYTGVETFELPPGGKVVGIILVNSVSSLVSDFAWAYAVLLTTPIVVTVGLSTTIPLSLIGQVLLNGQTASAVYWLGALVVVGSFVVVNYEPKGSQEPETTSNA